MCLLQNLALAMNFLPVLLCSLALIVGLRPILVDSGCCNENLWCDGDPRFDSSESFTYLEFVIYDFFNEYFLLCFFFTFSNWGNSWKKLVKTSDEFVTSFREQPIVSQWPNSTQVNITWSEAYVHLVKCVDYFFVKYAPTDAQRFQEAKICQK